MRACDNGFQPKREPCAPQALETLRHRDLSVPATTLEELQMSTESTFGTSDTTPIPDGTTGHRAPRL
jgi:hypothetical protein